MSLILQFFQQYVNLKNETFGNPVRVTHELRKWHWHAITHEYILLLLLVEIHQ